MDHASAALTSSANPGAVHKLGVVEKSKLETARGKIAKAINSNSNEIIFTSGATESNNLAILGLVQNLNQNSALPHIVTTNIEHASVLESFRHLERTKQATVTFVEVEANGIVDPRKIKKALNKNTVLVSVMYANNEIGTIQPIKEIAKEIRHFNKNNNTKVFFHTDATQAVNYLPIGVPQLGVDLMSFNGSKIYGPKGVGILYVKKSTPIGKIMFGGDQEMGLRPGTENVSLAIELALALEKSEKLKDKEVKRLNKLRDYFIKKITKIDKNIIINGDLKNRLPNNVNITTPNIPSDLLVVELSAKGVMASAKSACKSGDGKASHVIQALARTTVGKESGDSEVDGSIRFSLGRDTNKVDIDHAVKALSDILLKLTKWYN